MVLGLDVSALDVLIVLAIIAVAIWIVQAVR